MEEKERKTTLGIAYMTIHTALLHMRETELSDARKKSPMKLSNKVYDVSTGALQI